MNKCPKLPTLSTTIITLALMLDCGFGAQTFTTLYSFTAVSGSLSTNSDGARPAAGLILLSNTLYGTAWNGGTLGEGTVFAINTDGSSFTNLHSFNHAEPHDTFAELTASGNTLYGTAAGGGSLGMGAVFAVQADGTGFTNLYSFGVSDGTRPYGRLILANNILYGTTVFDGNGGNGTVFAIETNGAGFTKLHDFAAGADNSSGFYTNSDGAKPSAGLVLSGNTLYGVTGSGGTSGNGTVFAINTDGTGFRKLHDFTATSAPYNTNSDGANPSADLILSGSALYGTARFGGSSGYGTVFRLNTNGTDFANLHDFATGAMNSSSLYTNSDGAMPHGALMLAGNTLYGVAEQGGSFGSGTVFALKIDGTGFTLLHTFSGTSGPYPPTNIDGASPNSVILCDNTLYGTALGGGVSGWGTIFSIFLSPKLAITRSGADFVLSWPTNYAGFDYSDFTLQSTTNLTSPAWTTNSVAPIVINGQNVVTNPISGTQQFFRLTRPVTE